ncbi:klarsicht protein [Planococcus citri]|uniref:klarsicht protein n=1 Tax=Planococcus citri TaxID=170843 RepID=UPI0031F8DFD6
MPMDFENSSMKNSFSMSSLQPSIRGRLKQSDQAANVTPVLPNRAYNSLNHKLKKRSPEQECWRNSWGQDDQKDELWTAFNSNYQYLMNNNLIESCTEVKNDLNLSPSSDWTFTYFKQQYIELDSWLNSVQSAIYAKEENLTIGNIRLTHVEELQRKNYQRKIFVSQSSRLVTQYPQYKDEILEYVSQLNFKWDQLTQTVSPKRNISTDYCSIYRDVQRELNCLRNWIKAMEKKIHPLNFRTVWSHDQLKLKAKEHEIIQRDVESHGKTVLTVVKFCEKLSQSGTESDGVKDARCETPLKTAQHWERRWHFLYLRCLEWQCYIEEQLNNLKKKKSIESANDTGAESDDEQPASKHLRLEGYECTKIEKRSSFLNKNENNHVDKIMDTSESVVSAMNKDPIVNGNNNVHMIDSIKQSNQINGGDVQLNENFNSYANLMKLPLEEVILNDSALYNKSDKSASNYGVFYAKHIDTDSEHERRRKNGIVRNTHEELKSADESSEDEWTYTSAKMDKNGTNDNNSMDTDTSENEGLNEDRTLVESTDELRDLSRKVLSGEKLSKPCIQKLVEQVDELVQSPKKVASRKKIPAAVKHAERVREWLKKCHSDENYNTATSVGDSCDASGEYTTEDDDQYERRSSCDQTLTLIGSSRDNGIDSPMNESLSIADTPKVILRPKSNFKKSRPLSTSELPQCSRNKLTSQFSVSESALHKMIAPLKDAQGALSSSTIEECTTQTLDGSGCSMNSLRRRKLLKHRRRSNTGRKTHSGSADSLSSVQSPDSSTRRRSPTKLPSYPVKYDASSEPMSRRRFSSVERTIASDPANGVVLSTSGTETEEDRANGKCFIPKKLLNLPAFRLGPQYGAVTCRDTVPLSVTSTEEQLSSFSEQAWDSYQEKYMSEAYSEEPVDPDQVKKLLEFGDDYRNFIDSQSDCASSLTRRSHNALGYNKHLACDESSAPDSDSDLEDVYNFLKRSNNQLCHCEQVFAKLTAKPGLDYFVSLRNTCRENIRCHRLLLEQVKEDRLPAITQQVSGMLEKWQILEEKADDQEKICSLRKNVKDLHDWLFDFTNNMPNMALNINDRDQLERNIRLVKTELDNLNDKKDLITTYNARAHRLLNDSKYSTPVLKDEIHGLYRIWEEAHRNVTNQLSSLRGISSSWEYFDMNMSELKTVLREDHEALNVLNKVLTEKESITVDVASSMKNIAKYLPEKQHNLVKANNNHNNNNCLTHLDSDHVDNMSSFLMSTLNVEGSFSDSGISDSGSEHDLSERERRLGLLKKLARHLESVLAPGSEALLNIIKKIDEAEKEIRELQQTCRTLIKTADFDKKQNTSSISKMDKPSVESFRKESKCTKKAKSGDPESDPDKSRSRFWRVLRAALPFHVAIVVLICVACLLEPNCCDAINNLNLSLSPQLRYISGPPPT